MKFKPRTLSQPADMICGNETGPGRNHFPYRTGSAITRIFEEVGLQIAESVGVRGHSVADQMSRSIA